MSCRTAGFHFMCMGTKRNTETLHESSSLNCVLDYWEVSSPKHHIRKYSLSWFPVEKFSFQKDSGLDLYKRASLDSQLFWASQVSGHPGVILVFFFLQSSVLAAVHASVSALYPWRSFWTSILRPSSIKFLKGLLRARGWNKGCLWTSVREKSFSLHSNKIWYFLELWMQTSQSKMSTSETYRNYIYIYIYTFFISLLYWCHYL